MILIEESEIYFWYIHGFLFQMSRMKAHGCFFMSALAFDAHCPAVETLSRPLKEISCRFKALRDKVNCSRKNLMLLNQGWI